MASQNIMTGKICDGNTEQNCQIITLNSSELPYQQLPSAEDIALVWGTAFTSVIVLYLVSHCIGLVLNMIKRA